MRSQIALLMALPAIVSAFPAYAGESKAGMDQRLADFEKREASAEAEPSLLDPVGALLGTVSGIVGSIAQNISPDNKRPEPDYVFKEPGPNDSRGPCPALNLLANYGYLPRDGHVTFGEVVEATARGFNMATDLSSILAIFSILADGDIATESWYLGAGPGNVGGLNRHSTVEADVSPNKEDYYLGCGDNHHISSRLFKQNVDIVASSASKQFDIQNMGTQFAKNADFSKKNNPYIYYFPFPSIVSFVAYNFYPRYFSNGTFGAGGVANYESISSIIGAKLNEKTGEYEYVPERWPENWYRRATPYGAVEALTEGLTTIYSRNPIAMPIGQLGTGNVNVSTILCDLYMGLNSVTPLALAGESAEIQGGLTWAAGKLVNALSGTLLGCPLGSTSKNNFLFPNADQVGGPLNPPPSVVANTGNNVYYKTYFKQTPTKPLCNHVS